MLRSSAHLRKYQIQGTDDVLGQVGDFLFDDRLWTVRYLVVDTGRWLPGRLVLVSPFAVAASPDWEHNVMPVDLDRERIRRSPPIDEDEPVSRQCEKTLHTYYGWAPYWMAGPYTATMTAKAIERGKESAATAVADGDPHLRSVTEVLGYRIEAIDGDIGHVEDLIVDDQTWIVRYLVVDTKNWWPGKKVLVSPRWTRHVRWRDRRVAIDLTRATIRGGPVYDPSQPINRKHETRLYDYLGRPYYWT